ncbi:hypothetical protein LR48_Vigan03g097300 [Vigna angularis]|uniref:Uncharacterized protein n=1 Tax=Phaseolus angularis TaxID=3914 RepID=A0A0L9U491_PHAAN|nr:hypothetical protein LR48_Vigan03g097300 [Vigna angularis]
MVMSRRQGCPWYCGVVDCCRFLDQIDERSEKGKRRNQKRHKQCMKETCRKDRSGAFSPSAVPPLRGVFPLSATFQITSEPLRGNFAVEGKNRCALLPLRGVSPSAVLSWAWA